MRAGSRDEYEKIDGGSFILVDNVKDCVDLALSGVHIDGINCWTGDGSTAFFSSTWDEDWVKNSAAFKAGLI